jgi:hypothetical protein
MFAIITVFFCFVAVPMFLRLNILRRNHWKDLFDLFLTYGHGMQAKCIERLLEQHDCELTELNRSVKVNRHAKFKYANHPLQIRIYILLLIIFTSAAGFLVATLFVGEINARELLLEKPDLMRWSGSRRTLSLGI